VIPANGGVVLVHPAKQHAYEVAVALQKARMLRQFITGIYFKPEEGPYRLMRLLPSQVSSSATADLTRRRHAGLDGRLVRSWPYPEILSRTVGRNRWIDRLTGGRSGYPLAFQMTDAYASRAVARMRPRPWGVYGFDAASRRVFSRARALGIQTVFDMPIVRDAADTVLREYRALQLTASDLPARPSPEELRLADWVIAPSEAVAESVQREGFAGRGLFIVPFGVDTATFAPVAPRDARRFRVVFAGRLEVRKGLHYLLDAWRAASLNADLILAGSPGEPEFVERIRRDYRGLFTEAGNLGRRELASLLASADVFVLPSLAEGSALVTYEALACGVPCIVTRETGSVVRDGVDGFIVPARDPAAIRDRLALMFRDSDLQRRMSAAAAERGRQFTWSRYHDAIGHVMAQIQAAA
jgi:glycosyltransferase involved in cell wall biosynthesis